MQNLLSRHRKNYSWIWWIVGAMVVGGGIGWISQQLWSPVRLTLNVRLPKPSFISPISPKEKTEEGKKPTSTPEPGTATGYSAVYLDTDQVFYGKLERKSDRYLILTNAFYYQPGARPSAPGSIKIVKVGTELHKPVDRVHINRSRIVMTEQLTEKSKIVDAIMQYKAE